ncbi:MAG: putative manganese transporter [Candidatus Merdivicinus sp.]|jgi:hypothetical protein
MQEVLLDTLLDTLKALPILFVVYLVIEYLEARVDTSRIFGGRFEKFGPVVGALAGCVPQCGFSAAAASLYNEKILSASTLIAVFLATSDEAIPVMLTQSSGWKPILLLLGSKLLLAVLFGYLLKFTVFRKSTSTATAPSTTVVEVDGCGCCEHSHHGDNGKLRHIWICALKHTIQITLFIGVTMLAINLIVFWIGEDTLRSVLLSGSVFQPAITALIGLIPGCATSVLLTELFLSGSISFGAAVAGLSTGAGFGYLVLFKGCSDRKQAAKIVLWTYICAVAAGTLIQLFVC